MELISPNYVYIAISTDRMQLNDLLNLLELIEKNNLEYHAVSSKVNDEFSFEYLTFSFKSFYLLKNNLNLSNYYKGLYFKQTFNPSGRKRDFNNKIDIKKKFKLCSTTRFDWEWFELIPAKNNLCYSKELKSINNMYLFRIDYDNGDFYILLNNTLDYKKISDTIFDEITNLFLEEEKIIQLMLGINYGFFKENKELELAVFDRITQIKGTWYTYYL